MSLIIPANSAAASGGYEVANSLRFNPASNDRLTRTPAASGNRNKWTWSGWAKRGTDNQDLMLFSAYQNSSYETHLKFALGGEIRFLDKYNGSTNGKINTLAKFRDLSAWYHIVVVFDTGNSTSTDKLIIYVNGIRITDFDGSVMPSNASTYNVDGIEIQIGASNGSSDMNGYISEVCFIDNQALGADSFGEFDEDSGIWKPIDVSGLTFGTNGYFLEFKESGTSTNASGMGADTSGNTHHFAVNGLTAIDQSTDTCTNNFATLNALLYVTPQDLTDGNLTATGNTADNNGSHAATFTVPTSGKWYWEIKVSATDSGGSEYPADGLVVGGYGSRNQGSGAAGSGSSMYPDLYFDCQGKVERSNAGAGADLSGVGNAGSSGIKQFAIDMDNGAFYIGLNGTYLNNGTAVGVPTSGSTKTGVIWDFTPANYPDIAIAVSNYNDSSNSCNFGSPAYAISSGNTDGNGYGNFEYAVPSGYYSLCTKNQAEYG